MCFKQRSVLSNRALFLYVRKTAGLLRDIKSALCINIKAGKKQNRESAWIFLDISILMME